MHYFDRDKQKILGIELLKFLAAVLITNSHFKALYVEPYTSLGTFGAPGNALFFFISSYTFTIPKGFLTLLQPYRRLLLSKCKAITQKCDEYFVNVFVLLMN